MGFFDGLFGGHSDPEPVREDQVKRLVDAENARRRAFTLGPSPGNLSRKQGDARYEAAARNSTAAEIAAAWKRR